MARHIVLLGDSIFDNAVYVPAGSAVIEHVRSVKERDDRATLLAVDGATVSSVEFQLGRIPEDATHLVLSVGGNDALWMAGNIFSHSVADVRASLAHVNEVVSEFVKKYRALINELRELRRHLSICTIYDHVPGLEAAERAGLCVFNDVISRAAFEHGLTLIDLRCICREATDYSSVSPIEPSSSGGAKIARAIIEAVSEKPTQRRVVA